MRGGEGGWRGDERGNAIIHAGELYDFMRYPEMFVSHEKASSPKPLATCLERFESLRGETGKPNEHSN